MKKILLFLIGVLTCSFVFSQDGKLYLKNSKFKSGRENTYVYEPPKELLVPEKVIVQIAYVPSKNMKFIMDKVGDKYEFNMKLPDSTAFFMASVLDKKMKLVDNNNNKAYTVFLKSKSSKNKQEIELSRLGLVSKSAQLLKMDIPAEKMISDYEAFFNLNPKLKSNETYTRYLFLLHNSDPKKAEPLLLECVEKLIKKGDESSFEDAISIYSRLKMKEKYKETKELAIVKYPKGMHAKEKFGDAFSEKWEKEGFGVEALIKFVEDYKKNYTNEANKDLDERMLNSAYVQILNHYARVSDTTKLEAYSKLHTNKAELSNFYNNVARNLVGKELSSESKNLDYATYLSRKSIDIINERIKNLKYGELESDFDNYKTNNLATYAQIKFKLGKNNEAVDLMNQIAEKRDLYPAEKEKYAVYLEKSQGSEVAKNYLEKELIAGLGSKVMMKQLEEIYKKLNIPENEFVKIKREAVKLVSEKSKIDFTKKYGDFKGIDFALTNLEGKKVQLSELKGKVVVLDFWATWCGPCRVSFPYMQKMVEKYKGKPVEFLFINTGENSIPTETVQIASKFITEKKYDFNVLFDFEKEVSKKYQIKGIPTKIIIGKEGNIVSDSFSDGNMDLLIDEQIK
ncbi:TlpA disulfide reductase family protein [Flavobacterium gilvum]|uniref:Thioredoxin domain-containing protein n=1 Tax=Flavobacterium gilvum TaxID=1492737 RepID=A0AAC9N662_9FLAO|nr:TlpA disulfide reductase family protein [Flavobacterium gilvum]AOW09269.1 hypothetical protein EM308_06975 [Flavobacterium gilvum]KFC59511.1 hypothetical protein FEM08_16580 [Flavobacterium gilvum]